jgi:hypothetical protein
MVSSPMPPIPNCDPSFVVWTTSGWLWENGSGPGDSTQFSIEVERNRESGRSGDINVEFWLREEFFPRWYWLNGETDITVNQETGVPGWLTVDPDQILIPPNQTVTFVTDMTEFFVELKYRYRQNPQQQWSSEYTTPSYYVDYRGIWTLEYTSEHVTCCAGYYEFTSIRDSDDGTWNSISVPVYLGPSEQPLVNHGVATSAGGASKLFRLGVEWVAHATWEDGQAGLVQAPAPSGNAGGCAADIRRNHRGEPPGLAGSRSTRAFY